MCIVTHDQALTFQQAHFAQSDFKIQAETY